MSRDAQSGVYEGGKPPPILRLILAKAPALRLWLPYVALPFSFRWRPRMLVGGGPRTNGARPSLGALPQRPPAGRVCVCGGGGIECKRRRVRVKGRTKGCLVTDFEISSTSSTLNPRLRSR